MLPSHANGRLQRAQQAMRPTFEYFAFYQRLISDPHRPPNAADFAFGNPQEMPLDGFVNALAGATRPLTKDWFAYTINAAPACRVIADHLRARFNLSFAPEDIFITNGATGALHVAFNTLLEPGDEAVFVSPPWFFYEGMILAAGGQPVRVKINPETFDLDLDAIADALTPQTRFVLINSPNNPTGKIYPPETLRALAELLTEAGRRHGRPIFLISDEAYREIVYDGRRFPTPCAFYPYTLMIYTYGKTLLTPGQRLGYVAPAPDMPDKASVREALMASQILSGLATANALLQHALADIQPLSIDVKRLQARRDWLVGSLRESGYDVHVPEGTFYLLPRAPIVDDRAFCETLATHGIYALPGSVVELPGTFRLSLTANDEMVARSLPGFAAAYAAVAA